MVSRKEITDQRNARVAFIRQLLEQDVPRPEICRTLGISRSAMAGLIDRYFPHLKLSKKQRDVIRKKSKGTHGGKRTPPQPYTSRPDSHRKPKSRCLDMEDLKSGDCRYPEGDNPFTFCGAKVQAEKPYCDYHEKRTHQQGSANVAA